MNKITITLIILLFILIIYIIFYFFKKNDTDMQKIVIDKKDLYKTKSKPQVLQIVPCVITFSVHTFSSILSKTICKKLTDDATPHLKRSKVYNVPDFFNDIVRSSKYCSIVSNETDIVRKMASTLSGYPLSHVEHAQIVRYEEGDGFSEHYDVDNTNKSNPSWSRLATFMIYLNDEFIGGETEFPLIKNTITPETGKGVFWWNVHSGNVIHESKHKGRYIIEGTKWIINTWVHSIPIIEHKDLIWDVITITD